MENFGWHLLVNYVVRNADCHAKNIAVLYSGYDDVAYTPVYDLITTQAYPRFAANPPGLSVDGRRTWKPGKALERFFKARLGIASRQYARMVERLCDSAVSVGRELIAVQKNEPRWQEVARQMLHAWNDGMESLRSTKANAQLRPLTSHLAAAGISGPDPVHQERVVIGRSDLLARR
jgi:serine/threonine-protein kinase HipA